MTEAPVLGIVVPTLNEELRLPLLLEDLHEVSLPHRVIIADGGSADDTVPIAERAGATVVRSEPGRARQMNAGAAALNTPWLLFLHADSRLDPAAAAALSTWIQKADALDVGVFGFSLEGDEWFWRFIEFGQRLRQRMYGLAYGDQGLAVSRDRFHSVGGFPDQPLMEDVEILKRLKRGGRISPIDARLVTSPRRYESQGRWLGWLRNVATIGLYQMGVPAERLASWYGAPTERAPATTRVRRRLLVFAKAPQPGAVKTRLARDVGDDRAAAIYRRMGSRILAAVGSERYEVTVCFDPPGSRHEVTEWLGEAASSVRITYLPQSSGNLGERMHQAVRHALESADQVCVIGTDAPEVDARLIESAFTALTSVDCVIGPATDGGYYLIGLRAPEPRLFQQMEWSTPTVFQQTMARATAAGLSVKTLETLSDVDVLDDLPLELQD